jgi:hypothetical protein
MHHQSLASVLSTNVVVAMARIFIFMVQLSKLSQPLTPCAMPLYVLKVMLAPSSLSML